MFFFILSVPNSKLMSLFETKLEEESERVLVSFESHLTLPPTSFKRKEKKKVDTQY